MQFANLFLTKLSLAQICSKLTTTNEYKRAEKKLFGKSSSNAFSKNEITIFQALHCIALHAKMWPTATALNANWHNCNISDASLHFTRLPGLVFLYF